MSASETRGCCSASRVKTVTHVVELLNFVQDRIRMHGVHGFLESLNRPWRNLPKVRGRRVRHLSLGKTELTALPCDMFTDLLRRLYGRSK
jgi:hypothetical protein